MVILSKVLLTFLVALQIIGPSWVLVIQESNVFAQEHSSKQIILAGMRGVVTVTPGKDEGPGYAPNYRSELAVGDAISTAEESVAEILVENQGLVTIHEYSEVLLGKKEDGGVSIALQVGAAEWSVPVHRKEGSPSIFTTPNIRATSQGGLVTAEVQPSFGAVAGTSHKNNPYLIRTSLHAQSSSGSIGLLETFCVNEGSLSLEYSDPQTKGQEKTVSAGECVGFLNGQLRALGTKSDLADWRAVCLVGTHCEIPESAKKLIAKKQMAQALALEQALVGSESEEGEVDEGIILATTAANFQTLVAGSITPINPQPPCTIDPNSCEFDFPTDPNVGSSLPPVVGVTPPPGGSPGITPGNIQQSSTITSGVAMPGGWGLLTFLKGDFTADKELFLADSGLLATAPHLGKAPQNSLVVKDLSPIGLGSPSNQKLPIEFGAFTFNFPNFQQEKTSNVQVGTEDFNNGESINRRMQLGQLAQFSRSSSIDPDNILASLPDNNAEFPCQFSVGSCLEVILAAGLGGLETPINPDPNAGIDAAIQVRSPSTSDPASATTRLVTLKSGVVLGNTQVALSQQQKTRESFLGLETTLGQEIQGSAVSIIGEPGNPALVNVEDRILSVLNGSSIQSADPLLNTALLTVLDGTLTGPVVPPVIGKDAGGADIVRGDVPPLIEVIGGSADVSTGVMVGSTANNGQTGILDQALLDASSPILAMINGSLTTASDFGRVAGQNAKLDATLLPGDALVRLTASSLVVNGNLFSVTGGAQLHVDGASLLSVQNGSVVSLNDGVFASVGAGSLFSLTNGALVDFGPGSNVVNVSNTLCASGGCFAPFANPGWQVAGSPADFSAPSGFNPFLDLGTFSDGSVNTLNVGQNAAILAVEPGGSIQIQ